MNISRLAFCVASFSAFFVTSHAASVTWLNTGTNAWSVATNWSSNPAIPANVDDLFFNAVGADGTTRVNIDGSNRTANSLTFNNTGTTSLIGSGNRDLALTGGINLNAGAGQTIIGSTGANTNVYVRITGSQTWTNNSGSELRITNAATASLSGVVPVTLTLTGTGVGAINFSNQLNNGAGGAVLSLVVDRTGGGVSLAGGNYGGGTVIRSGLLTSSAALGTGAVLLGDTSGTNSARLNNSGTISSNITVQAGSSGTMTLSGDSGKLYTGNVTLNNNVILGSASSGATVTYSGAFTGTGNVIAARIGANNANVILSGTSTYTGKTVIESSNVTVSSLNSVVGGTSFSSLGAPVTAANGTITMSGSAQSTLRYVGNGETTDRVIEIASNNNAILDQSGTVGNLNFTSALANSGVGSRTLQLTGNTAGTGEFSGAINNIGTGTNVGVTKNGTGTWRLSGTANTYAGTTSVAGGVLEVVKMSDANVASSIGMGAGTSLTFSGGTLRYIGTGDSSNRAYQFGALGGTFDASGSGAINYTRTNAPTYGTAGVAVAVGLTGTNMGMNTYAANLSNNGVGLVSLTKSGIGTWVLTGNLTNTGTTIVSAGTLLLNGSSAAAVAVNGGVFGGTGTITNAVSIGDSGTLAPGNSPGILNTGSLALTGSTSTIAMEISGTGAGQYDQVNVTGGVSLDGNGKIEVTMLSFVPQPTEIYFLILNDGGDAISGTLFGIAQGGTFTSGGHTWQVSYTGNSATNSFSGGNDLALQMVPEPSTLALIGSLAACALLRRRRSQA